MVFPRLSATADALARRSSAYLGTNLLTVWEKSGVHPNLVGCIPCDFPLVRIEYGTEAGNFVRSGKPPARPRLLETLADQTVNKFVPR